MSTLLHATCNIQVAKTLPGPWGLELGQWTHDSETGLATWTHTAYGLNSSLIPWEKDVSQATLGFCPMEPRDRKEPGLKTPFSPP